MKTIVMELKDLGFNEILEKYRIEQKLDSFGVGRIIAEHKERYIVRTTETECDAEITGNMRFTAKSREDFPAVGDWVALTIYNDLAIIHTIFPRYSVLKRIAAGNSGEIQVIAANIDYAFLVQAVDRDFNVNRIERYLTICYSAGVNPVIVLGKTDLISGQKSSEIANAVKTRIRNVPVIAISNKTKSGYEELYKHIQKGKTYCLLGSSGVGKSSLLNNLCGKSLMETGAVSQSTGKGRHVTSHRELIILPNGGLLIDNPGMREVGIADTTGGLETAFDRITELSQYCRFRDCTHTGEDGCSVLKAVEEGEIDRMAYENYLKMEKERAHYESTIAEKRQKDKVFGRMMKDYHKRNIKNRNY